MNLLNDGVGDTFVLIYPNYEEIGDAQRTGSGDPKKFRRPAMGPLPLD
jgi:hypothetical protein